MKRTFINTINVGGQSIQCERLHYKYSEIHKAVNIRRLGNNHKAKALWVLRDAKTNGEAHYDRSSERQLLSRASVMQALERGGAYAKPDSCDGRVSEKNTGWGGRAESSTPGGREARASTVSLLSQSRRLHLLLCAVLGRLAFSVI